ncbi:hypothetical protein BHE74_00018555 [Ensete ventricosum]|nr:hypothetical protein BHE74_00018555 [Ensete ventricosum]
MLRNSTLRQYLHKAQRIERVTRSHCMISNEVMHWWMHYKIKWRSDHDNIIRRHTYSRYRNRTQRKVDPWNGAKDLENDASILVKSEDFESYKVTYYPRAILCLGVNREVMVNC